MLTAHLLDSLVIVLIQVIDFDGKFPPEVVQERLGNRFTLCWRGMGQCGMQVFPLFLGSAQFVQRSVLDFQQATLFQIRGSDPPASSQVLIDAIGQDLSQCPLCFFQRCKLDGRIDGIQLLWQVESVENTLGQFVMDQSI